MSSIIASASVLVASPSGSRAVGPVFRPVPTFNYHEMDDSTLRGILKVTSSVHPQAGLIGKELQTRNYVNALRMVRDCTSGPDCLLESNRQMVEDILEQDDLNRQNLCSSGMSYVVFEEKTRAKYEEVLKLIVDEIDARAIETSPNEAHERSLTPPPASPADDEEAAYYAEMAAQYAEEEAERQKLIAEGKCPDCHRPKCENRHGECVHCLDDSEQAEEKEARRDARMYYYVNGARLCRRTGEPC